jgi:hypothetical protein
VGAVRATKQVVENNDYHIRHVCVCERFTTIFRGEEGEPLHGRVQNIVFQVAVTFLNIV